jgi:hypothetical protein
MAKRTEVYNWGGELIGVLQGGPNTLSVAEAQRMLDEEKRRFEQAAEQRDAPPPGSRFVALDLDAPSVVERPKLAPRRAVELDLEKG